LFSDVCFVPAVSTAQRTGVARDFPIYNNGGKPDIVITRSASPPRWRSSTLFEPDHVSSPEGAVGASATGAFAIDTVLMNRGDKTWWAIA
jgi:hypothetical protein